jgi:hypothetical protein
LELVVDLGSLPVPHDDGHFISERISRVVDIIRETWPMLDVKWIPPELRAPGDAAFAIVERLPDGREFVVFHVDKEEDFDHRVLARIYAGDNTQNNVLAEIEAQDQALRAYQQKAAQEQMDEANEFAAFVLKGGRERKNWIRHNGWKFD